MVPGAASARPLGYGTSARVGTAPLGMPGVARLVSPSGRGRHRPAARARGRATSLRTYVTVATTLSGAVLAGGASRRMGRDKALVEVDGVPMAGRVAAALRDAGAAEVLAVGGDAEALARLGLTPVADRWPGEGPLGGIVTALHAAAHDVVAVLACDLPFVTGEAITAIVDALGDADADAAVADVLLAVYRRSACLAPLEAALLAGERAPRHAFDGLDVVRVTLPDPSWAANVNRPEDLP